MYAGAGLIRSSVSQRVASECCKFVNPTIFQDDDDDDDCQFVEPPKIHGEALLVAGAGTVFCQMTNDGKHGQGNRRRPCSWPTQRKTRDREKDERLARSLHNGKHGQGKRRRDG